MARQGNSELTDHCEFGDSPFPGLLQKKAADSGVTAWVTAVQPFDTEPGENGSQQSKEEVKANGYHRIPIKEVDKESF